MPPWFESGAETAAEDPFLVQRLGEPALQVRAAEALLKEAARAVDAARARLTDGSGSAAAASQVPFAA